MSDKSLKKVYKKLYEYSNRPSPYQTGNPNIDMVLPEPADPSIESSDAMVASDSSEEVIEDLHSHEGERLDPQTEAILQAEFSKKMRV